MYYIQNVKKSWFAPLVAWWKFNSLGYTPNIDEAKKFDKAEIESRISIQMGDKRAWPVEYIDGFGKNLIQEKDLDIEMAWKGGVK